MNRYSLSIEWKFYGKYEVWKMIVVSDNSKEYVTEVIKNYQKDNKIKNYQKDNNVEFESPVELMDAICYVYGWQWEDFNYDIEIEF